MPELKCTDEKLGSLIAAYELGTLDASQREAFVEHVFNCPYCNEELYSMDPYMNLLRSEVARLRQRASAVAMDAVGLRWRWVAACAAAVVLVVLGPYLYFAHQNPPRGNAHLQIDVPKAEYVPASDNARVGAGGAFKAAMGAYQRDDFQSAAVELEALIHLEPENIEARFYRGVSLLLLGDDDEATWVLKEAAERAAATPLREGCQYYLALAYARTGHVEQASAEAAAVIDMKGKYRAQAESLVRALKSP